MHFTLSTQKVTYKQKYFSPKETMFLTALETVKIQP